MVPVDVCAFVHVAELATRNPVALLLMALVQHPTFVMEFAEAVDRGLCITAAGMAKTLHRLVWDLDTDIDAPFDQRLNIVAESHMLGLCTTMQHLGMLTPSDDSRGVALGATGKRYNLVSTVPLLLTCCFLITESHYIPIVSASEDIPGYMASWAKLLPRLPAALNVSHAGLYPFAHVMRKLLVWQRSRFKDNMPLTVGMAASWCSDSLELTCSTCACMRSDNLTARACPQHLYVAEAGLLLIIKCHVWLAKATGTAGPGPRTSLALKYWISWECRWSLQRAGAV